MLAALLLRQIGRPTELHGLALDPVCALLHVGGRVIDVGHDGKKLEEAFDQIQDELRTQYLLSYTSTNEKEDATFRTIKLTCGATAKIQARRGYYAIPDGVPDKD